MATSVQRKPSVVSSAEMVGIDNAGFLSITMTALRLTLPWAAPKPAFIPSPQERIITLDEASWHDNSRDCWIIIYDRVYDITTFLDKHPGGSDVLLEYAGRDATVAFRGTGHSTEAINGLRPYLLGQLPICECIYRKPGGINLSGLPE